MFAMPPHQEGISNEHPIVITLPSKATVNNFCAFILFLMPTLAHDIVWDVTAWISVLCIANWAMHKSTRDGAIRHLDSIVRTWPPTQLYWLAQEHRVLEWHIHAVKELLSCPEAMSACKVDNLGSNIVLCILNIHLHEERAANVRIYNQMYLNMRNLVQRLYNERGSVVTMNQTDWILDSMSDLALWYRAALPSVVSLMGNWWVTVTNRSRTEVVRESGADTNELGAVKY
jgi:hypothetical protein